MTSPGTDTARRRRILEAFEAVIDLAPAKQDAWLGRAFAGDPDAVRAVKALVEADALAPAALPTVPGGITQGDEGAADAPDRIGPYALTARIGAGGMGDVWRGERVDGLFEQAVAIKLLRPSGFEAQARAYFESERKLLARLNHPNIARILDGGVAEGGRPWFIMELIEGESLADWLAAHAPALESRVRLMISICDAVQAAHQSLVVHADLKPSNILVTDAGVPHLVDFGIGALAFATETSTSERGFPSTPAYASPERRAGDAPTTSDDIYALGLILAGVLTDVWPTAPCDAPPVPSAQGPDRARAALRGDLDAIARTAAAGRREARYASAGAMADDLRAWLGRRPIAARRGEPAHVALRFVQRHPLAVTTALVALVAVLGALAAMTALYNRAERERASAEARFEDVRQLASFMLGDLYGDLDRLAGASRLKARTTDMGRRYLERIAGADVARADLAAEVAVGLGRVGHASAVNSANGSGDVARGEADLALSEARLEALVRADPSRADLRTELARTLTWRSGVLLNANNDAAGADAKLDAAFRLLNGVLAARPDDAEAGYARMNAVLGRADVLVARNRLTDLIALVTPEERRLLTLPVGRRYGAERALIQAAMENALGDATYYAVSPNAGLSHYMSAVRILDAARGVGTRDVRIPLRLALYEDQVASALEDMKRAREGLTWAERGRALAQEVARYDDSALSDRALAILDLETATLLSDLGRHDASLKIGAESVARRRAELAADPDDQELRIALAGSLRSFAESQIAAGRRREACASVQSGLALLGEAARHGGVPERYQALDLAPLRQMAATCPP